MFSKRYYHLIRLFLFLLGFSGAWAASGERALGGEVIKSSLIDGGEGSLMEEGIRVIVNNPMRFLTAVVLGGVIGGTLGAWEGVIWAVVGTIIGGMLGGVAGVVWLTRRVDIPVPREEVTVVAAEPSGIPTGYMATIFDFILLLLLLFFGYRGFQKGLFSQFFSTVATLVFLFFGKRIFYVMLGVSASLWPGLDRDALPFAAFSLLLLLGFCFVYISEKLLKRLLADTFIGYLDSLLGGVLGVVQAAFCLSALFLVLGMYEISLPEDYTDKMRVYQFVSSLIPETIEVFQSYLPSYVTSFLPNVAVSR